jgi:hypothetical protein
MTCFGIVFAKVACVMYSENDLQGQLERLKVVPVSDLKPSARVNPREVDRIALELKTQGVLRHPLLTTRLTDCSVVLDGNARLLAASQMGLPDILVQEIPAAVLPEFLPVSAMAALSVPLEEIYRIVEASFKPDTSEVADGLRLIIKPDDVRVMPASKDKPLAIWETFGRMVTALKAVADVVPLYDFRWGPSHADWSLPRRVVLAPPPLPLELFESLSQRGLLLPANALNTPVPERILGINLSLKVLFASEPSAEKTAFVRELIRLRMAERRIQYYDAPVYIVES